MSKTAAHSCSRSTNYLRIRCHKRQPRYNRSVDQTYSLYISTYSRKYKHYANFWWAQAAVMSPVGVPLQTSDNKMNSVQLP